MTCLQFDDTRIVSGALDRLLKIWNIGTGEVHVNNSSSQYYCHYECRTIMFSEDFLHFQTVCLPLFRIDKFVVTQLLPVLDLAKKAPRVFKIHCFKFAEAIPVYYVDFLVESDIIILHTIGMKVSVMSCRWKCERLCTSELPVLTSIDVSCTHTSNGLACTNLQWYFL